MAKANMSHTQGDQAQGREEACSEWKRRGCACYFSGSSYLRILLPICRCPPSPQLSGCLPANHRGRQCACFHTFHSQLPCTCISSAPNSVLPVLPCPDLANLLPGQYKTNYTLPGQYKNHYTQPTMGSKDSDKNDGPQGSKRPWGVLFSRLWQSLC